MVNSLFKVVGMEEFTSKDQIRYRSLHLLSVSGDRVAKIIFKVDYNQYLADVLIGDFGVVSFRRSADGRGFENFTKVDVSNSGLS